MSPPPCSPAERTAYRVSMAAVVLVHLVVLWIPAYNTLVDFPVHLARAWALHTYAEAPFFQKLFVRTFEPIANMAIDLIAPPLFNFLSPIVAGKAFLSLIVLLFAVGCHWLGAAVHGRSNWMAPVSTFAVFNSTFLWGYVNSMFGLSLFLVTFAAWLTFRCRWTVLRWLAATSLATATFIAHLSGFAFLVLAMSICRLLEFPRGARSGADTIKPAQEPVARQSILHILFRKTGFGVADLVGFSVLLPALVIQLYPWVNKVRISGYMNWGTPGAKAIYLASVFIGHRPDVSIVTAALLAGALCIAMVKGKLRPAPMLLWSGMAFLAACFICPSYMFGAAGADARFVPPAMVFLLMSLPALYPRGAIKLSLAIAFAAMMLRLGDVGWHLLQTSSAAELQVAALARAVPNSRIYEIFIKPQDRSAEKRVRGNVHLPSYSLILTQSVSSDFIALRGVQPLYFRNPMDWPFPQDSFVAFDRALLDARLSKFDYIWGCNLDPQHRDYAEHHATLVSTGDVCGLWRLDKPRAAAESATRLF